MITFKKVNESAYTINANSDVLFNIQKLCSCQIPNARFLPAVKMGYSDGIKRFYQQIDENTILVPRGLAISLKTKLEKDYNCVIEGLEEDCEQISMATFMEFVKSLNIPFEPFDYQLQAALDCINNNMRICEMATGSGKSLTIYLICRWFMEKLPENDKILLIVPSIVLLNQMYSDFKDYGFEDINYFVDRLGGDYKLDCFMKKINITTWQSLYRNVELFADIKVLIEDEVHTAASDVHEKIIYPSAVNTIKRFGFTGTLPKTYMDRLILSSILGKAHNYITSRQLIDRGLATEITIKPIILKYNNSTSVIIKNIKTYQQEVSFILGIPERENILAKLINKVSKSGNTIVLFSRIASGEAIALKTVKQKYGVDVSIDELRQLNDYGIFFISGETNASQRELIRQILEKYDDAILFGTSSIISTGINIKKLKNLVNTFSGKSYIKVNQSIGRMLRTHESKNGIVYLYDIVDDARGDSGKKNYLLKHYIERLGYYNENCFTVDKEIVIGI